MSACCGCYFHGSGYMYNSCGYFGCECFNEPNECIASSSDGHLTEEQEDNIFKETGGGFGRKMSSVKRVSCETEEEVLEVLRKLEKDGYIWSSTHEKPTKWLPRPPVLIGMWDDNTITFTRDDLDFNVSAKEFVSEGEKMRTEYVIEIESEPYTLSAGGVDGVDSFYKIKGTNVLFHASDLNNLPTADDMRNDAYEKGKNEQFAKDSETINTLITDKEELSKLLNAFKSEAEKLQDKLQDKTWDAARKICLPERFGGISYTELANVFGKTDLYDIMTGFTASEAIAKLDAYEEEKAKERADIGVGDEVESKQTGYKYIIYSVNEDNVLGYSFNASQPIRTCNNRRGCFDKTGRHFPQIKQLVEAMSGNNE